MKPGDIFKEITGLTKIPESTVGIWEAILKTTNVKKVRVVDYVNSLTPKRSVFKCKPYSTDIDGRL